MVEKKYAIKIAEPVLIGELHLDKILMHMVKHGGSDTFFLTEDPIWMSLLGKKEIVLDRRLSKKDVESFISYITNTTASIGKLGKGERINHAYEIKIKKEDENKRRIVERHRFRINAVTTTKNGTTGIAITARTIPTTPPSASSLGVEQEIIDVFKKSKKGLILVSGATGSGKSTLLASLISECLMDIDGNHHLVTIESPVEFIFDDIKKPSSLVNQLQVGQGIESFHEGVVNSLRMAPTMIEIGETRDAETAEAAIDASNTGHLVLTTLHANSASATVERFVSLCKGQEKKARIDLVSETKMIITQQLVPTIDGKRTAIKEFLIFNREIREFLFEDLDNLTRRVGEAVRKWGQPMEKDIIRKRDMGVISDKVAEVLLYNYE